MTELESTFQVAINEINQLCQEYLQRSGFSEAEAQTISSVLEWAELRENSQGYIKTTTPPMKQAKDASAPRVVRERGVSCTVDGGQSHAMVATNFATELAIEKAKNLGVALVALNNTSTSSGALGFYTERIAREGLIGFACAGAPALVAPYGSKDKFMSTNPLSVAIPTKNDPILIDLSTAAISFFELLKKKNMQEELAASIAIDSSGNVTTSAEAAMSGAILPFGNSAKGSALSLLVEFLCGPLIGAGFALKRAESSNWGSFVAAFAPDLFCEKADYEQELEEFITSFKSLSPAPGFDEVLLPGERGNKVHQKNQKIGEIEIAGAVYDFLKNS